MARVPLSQRPDIPGSQLIQAPRATNLQGIDSGLLRANQNLANQFDNLVEIEGQIGALDQARDDKREVDTRIASSKLWQIQAKQEYNGLQGQERIENQPVYRDNYRKHIQDTANQIINPRAREVYLSNMQTQMAMGFADNSKSVTSARNHAEAEVKKLQAQLALTGVVNTDVSDVAAREIVVAELALTIKENYDLIGIPTDTKEGQALRAQGLNIAMSEATLTDVKQRLSQDPPDLEGAARLMADPMVQRTLTEAARSEISGLIANTGQIAAGQAVVERLMLDPKIAEDEGLMRDAIMKELEGKAQNEALRLNTANFAAKVRQNTMAERAVTSELMLALNENRKPNLTADQILLMKRRGLDKTVEADRIARINPEKLRPPTPDGEEAVYKLRRDPEKFMNENFHTPYWHGALGKTWAETVNLQLADIAKFENVNVKLSKEQAKLHKAGVDSDNIKSAIEGDPAYEKADANHQAEARQAAALAIDADLKANPNLKLNDIITGDYVRAALLGTLRKDNSFRTFMGIEKSIPLGTAILKGVTISPADNEGLKNAMWARVKRTKGLSRARVDQLIDIFIKGKQLPTPARLKEYHRRDTNQKRLNAAINRLNQVVTADFETIPQASETVPAPEEAPDSTAKAGPVTKKQADAEVAEVASASSEIVELTVQDETKAEADALEIIQALPEAAQTDQNIAAQITSTKARMLKKKQDAAKVPQRQAPFPPSERAALFREFDVPTEEDIAARKTALTATIAATRRVREKLAPQSQEKLDALASETELQRQRADNGGITDAELKEFQKAPPIPKGKNLGSRGEGRPLEQTTAPKHQEARQKAEERYPFLKKFSQVRVADAIVDNKGGLGELEDPDSPNNPNRGEVTITIGEKSKDLQGGVADTIIADMVHVAAQLSPEFQTLVTDVVKNMGPSEVALAKRRYEADFKGKFTGTRFATFDNFLKTFWAEGIVQDLLLPENSEIENFKRGSPDAVPALDKIKTLFESEPTSGDTTDAQDWPGLKKRRVSTDTLTSEEEMGDDSEFDDKELAPDRKALAGAEAAIKAKKTNEFSYDVTLTAAQQDAIDRTIVGARSQVQGATEKKPVNFTPEQQTAVGIVVARTLGYGEGMSSGEPPTDGSGLTYGRGVDLLFVTKAQLKTAGATEKEIKTFAKYLGKDKTKANLIKAGDLPKKGKYPKMSKTLSDNLAFILMQKDRKAIAKDKIAKNLSETAVEVLISLRHWAGKLGNTASNQKAQKLVVTKDGARTNPVWNALEGKEATDETLLTALKATLAAHTVEGKKRRIRQEIKKLKTSKQFKNG